MIRIKTPDDLPVIITDLRAITRLSQRALVAEAKNGFSQAQLSMWEGNHSSPSFGGLIRLARALGYDLALVPREDS